MSVRHGLGDGWMAVVCAAIACGLPVLMTGCDEPPAQRTPEKTISVLVGPGVSLLPATSGTVKVEVDRAGQTGEVTLTVGAAPAGIRARAAPIPAGARTGAVVITAHEGMGDAEVAAAIPVTATIGGLTGHAAVHVRVSKIEPPRFVQDGVVLVQPGGRAAAALRVEWPAGPRRPVELKPRDAGTQPGAAEVSVTTASIGPDDDEAALEVTASGDAPEGERTVALESTFMGRSRPVDVRVKVVRQPFRVGGLQAAWLAPGETRAVMLPVTRDAHDGPIELSATGLPEGVTASPVSIAAGAGEATLELRAASDAAPRMTMASVVGKAGGLVVEEPLIVRVRPSGDDLSLPESAFESRDAARLMQRGSIGGRLSSESKQALSEMYGGTPEASAAVRRGLAWLARTQQADGSWTLKGADALPAGEPAEEEPHDNATAATAFALLPFLGEGITHKKAPAEPAEFGKYTYVVEKGLAYLAAHQVRGRGATDGFFGDSMYAHSLATIAFCEAFGLSRDDRLRINARQGVKYLLAAQDPAGGGWRYTPRQKGDLSVTGWVVIALRSGQFAGMGVPAKQIRKAERFVESLACGPADAAASRYRYDAERPESRPMTAAGLLSRLYLGWKRDEPDLAAGEDYLMEHIPPSQARALGPSYFYYYATQVLHHVESEHFDVWNYRMREHLLRLQRTSGDLEGSWDPQGCDHGKEGGRMYATVMSLLTLQVYYRHLPLFRDVLLPASSAADDGGGQEEPMDEPPPEEP